MVRALATTRWQKPAPSCAGNQGRKDFPTTGGEVGRSQPRGPRDLGKSAKSGGSNHFSQRALSYALIFPEWEKGGRGRKVVNNVDNLSREQIKRARRIVNYRPDLIVTLARWAAVLHLPLQ